MPVLPTNNFGPISFDPEALIEFPRGLPGFEERRSFLPLQIPDTAPLIFLQSADEPSLCFPTLPVLAIDADYQLRMSAEDLQFLELPAGCQPRLGEAAACLAILSLRETGPTANLLAPVVINMANHKAIQSVALESEYSHQHPLTPPEAAPACS
jgi:flagellar assembly factor FliW